MRLRTLLAAVAATLPLTIATTTPATAASAHGFALQGSGTISPGLGAVPETQSVSLTGTATLVGTSGVVVTYNCSFSGIFEASIGGGIGRFSGSCGRHGFATCVVVHTTPTWEGACTGGTSGEGAQFDCVYRPHQTLPTTSYDLTCTGAMGRP